MPTNDCDESNTPPYPEDGYEPLPEVSLDVSSETVSILCIFDFNVPVPEASFALLTVIVNDADVSLNC